MGTKYIRIFLGIGLLIVGIIISLPVLSNLFGGVIKGYSLSNWHWFPEELGKVIIGGLFAVVGIIVLVIGSSRKIVDSSTKPIKNQNTNKFVYSWRLIFLNLLPILISIGSCIISIRSCDLSEKAIINSTKQFFAENKPYITITLRKLKESQSYYKYKLLPDQNTVQIQFEYTIKNIGSVAAKDLSLFNGLVTNVSTKPTKVIIPGKLTLCPGQNYVLGANCIIACENKDRYHEYVQKLSSEKGVEITILMRVYYISEINPEQKFHSTVVNKITKERAGIIKMVFVED